MDSSTLYDVEFGRIKNMGLTWLPWVGGSFSQRPPDRRLFVVGESHYYGDAGDTPEVRKGKLKSWMDEPQSTRQVAWEQLLKMDEWDRGNKTLDRIPQLLFKTREIHHDTLWGDTAFYNIVQRPINGPERERPSRNDFLTGWKIFAEVAKILEPSHCLFIGVTAARYFNLGEISWHEQKVAGVWPWVAKVEIPGQSIKLIFVHHLSRCNGSERIGKWHDYLVNQHADLMDWLTTEGYQRGQTN